MSKAPWPRMCHIKYARHHVLCPLRIIILMSGQGRKQAPNAQSFCVHALSGVFIYYNALGLLINLKPTSPVGESIFSSRCQPQRIWLFSAATWLIGFDLFQGTSEWLRSISGPTSCILDWFKVTSHFEICWRGQL
jgi:hypothetical protein